jgi:two-component system LytT family sensor kinase
MIVSGKQTELEFMKLERWVKFIVIPLFIIFSIIFLTPYPFHINTVDFLRHVIFSFIGIFSIWFSIKAITYFSKKYCNNLSLALRLSFQIIVSCILSVSIIIVLHAISHYVKKHEEPPDSDFKNLLLTVILFSFLINTIYEIFDLFLKLSAKALETERYKKENIEAQYQNLTSRLNPHFLFNSLNTLATIVEEDSNKAVDYIRELSIVYRYVLNSQKSTWTDLASELTFTNSYITLMKMRFEENLRVSLDIKENYKMYCILPLTIQLLIENAVKHNEISRKHPLDLKIHCEDEYLIVYNNKQKRTIMPSSTKVGLLNITERYRFLVNKEVIIEDTENTFTVKIPLVKITV